ncbi:DENN domain-containing protein 3 [Corythoichthys intestinalis]|uniref:DENN domain-containing protein 3 n=1 Tax=Corythoichthys intestinalis TaxID=161448 RepID=UPI0025A627EA|nr:DENN domain-containing protein 3 [Corythoichthys intestinalis]XP_057684255.1 DENN domain-containing protein 3 [Corythoichthys intestinalis]XP_061808577.1 DENN domain-containing protein 3-like [Nerophis lumbriciformis]
MAELPSGLLEACVVVGASNDKLRDVYQLHQQKKFVDFPLMDAEVLQVHIPPFVTKETNSSHAIGPSFSRVQRRRSFIKKRRDRVAGPTHNGESANHSEVSSATEDISVPKDLDLIALPQLCFPGGLQLAHEQKEDAYHFLVFTDLLGNRTHGVVAQFYRSVQSCQEAAIQNGHRWISSKCRLFTPFAVCVISKLPYYNALRDCLSCLLAQLRPVRQADFAETLKEFSAKLSLVPLPPPGQLHVCFSLRPLQVVLPSREEQDSPIFDVDLHLPLLCFSHATLLQILSCLLQEQRLVFFSSDWARLTLVAECLLLYLQPLTWQHPYVPVLSRGMLDFLMAPTAFLMGCHISHFEEVAAETEDLILVNIDDGIIQSSWADVVDLATIPLTAAECFISRAESLQLHYDLELCHLGSATDANAMRAQRRAWQRRLNKQIQNICLELLVNIFRGVQDFLNHEHRVFNSEEFLRNRDPSDQLFYKKVLDTHIFHSFLRDRLNRKQDSFSRMEQNTRNLAQRNRGVTESPRRPPMSELSRNGYNSYASPDNRLSKRLGASMPNLDQSVHETLNGISPVRPASLRKMTPDIGLKLPQKPVKVFRLPEFPPPLAYHYVQNYYSEMVANLGKAISATPPEESALLARYHYLRGLVNTVSNRRLDALEDFQSLYKTDSDIFPLQMVKSLVDSLPEAERLQADRRPELKRLISRLKRDQERERHDTKNDDGAVKRFQLPKKYMHLDEFVKCVQESGIVKDLGTIYRLFDALTVGHQKQVGPDLFRVFYTIWKETEAEAQEVCLPASVLEHIEPSECVFKLSSSVKTSRGVGKIAMTQRRLFLLTDGRPGYVEVAQYRDLEEVKVSSAPFLLLRIPSLKLRVRGRKEAFEANLKTETELWNLMVKEMWAGRDMADQHKDPQYMQQALTNALLMDAVVGSLQSSKATYAASKLAHFDRIKMEVPMMVPRTTAEALKHKINPSLELAAPRSVDVLLYTPGQLWVSVSGGKVMVFDASSWSLTHTCQVGNARLNCMLAVDKDQVWMGSEDSVIYIISIVAMVCNRQLTDHRSEVTGLALDTDKYSQKVAYSCSAEGTVIVWDVSTLQVKKNFRLSCDRLQSVYSYNVTLWCCSRDSIMEVWRNGTLKHRLNLPEQHKGSTVTFSTVLLIHEREELWSICADSGDVCIWHAKDASKPYHRVALQDCTGCHCMIKVKNQVWVGGVGRTSSKGKVYILDVERRQVLKELHGHSDKVTALCSAEDRYVLSGAAKHDGKIAIWKVE